MRNALHDNDPAGGRPADMRRDIVVRPYGAQTHGGLLQFGPHRARCALGRHGVTATKTEGDKKTPLGRFALRRVWYRPDRLMRPDTALPIREIRRKSGWCDDSAAARYNQPITRPNRHSHEKLWRHDRLYDVFIELGVNDAPAVAGAGSAIFLHLTKNNFQATLGCVAVSDASMDFVLRHAASDTFIHILDRPERG